MRRPAGRVVVGGAVAVAVAVAAAVALAGAGGGERRAPVVRTAGAGGMVPIRVVGGSSSPAPRACRVRRVAERLRAFSAAFSAGRVGEAVRSFAAEPAFQWYSMGDNRRGELRIPQERMVAIYDRSRLRAYFARRVRQDEHLRPIAIRVGRYDRFRRRLGLEIVGVRTADDLAGLGVTTDRARGKGSIDCRSGRIQVLSLGMAYGAEVHGYFCGWRRNDPVPAAILACGPRR